MAELLRTKDEVLEPCCTAFFDTHHQAVSYQEIKDFIIDYQQVPLSQHLENQVRKADLNRSNLKELAERLHGELLYKVQLSAICREIFKRLPHKIRHGVAKASVSMNQPITPEVL